MKLSFIVPLYNERRRIQKTIREIKAFRKILPYENEWIFVDDGSSDGTETLARQELGEMPYCWIRLDSNRGKGRAVQVGMSAGKGEYLFFTDADLSTPLGEFERLFQALRNGYDLAIGSRGPGAQVLVHQNFLRETMGKVFNRIARLLTFKAIRDSQCGFKGFRRETAEKLFPLQKTTGFSFDAEILFLAQKMGFRIAEIPVTWINSRDSKVRIVRDSFLMLTDLFRIRWIHRNLTRGGA